VFGGVFGQICGLTLGQPLEMHLTLPMIRDYLQGVDGWPLSDYVPSFSPTQKQPLRRDCIESMKGFVHLAKEDDDLNYLVLNSKIMEDNGSDFTTEQVAKAWHFNLAEGWTWGPENSRLFLLGGMFFMNRTNYYPEEAQAETFVRFLNDGEEAIGAMIRGEAFGVACPGKPALAAEFAWRDGRLTHTKTGLYAEMWLSATIAAAYTTNDPVVAIRAGIDQIPEHSRYAECLREALKISLEEKNWIDAWKRIDEKWGYLGHAGTFNESAAMINGLVHSVNKFGIVDYEMAITITVMHGWDCDCSGAMVGSIAGVMVGYENIPGKWTKPLNDMYHSGVATERETRISKLAERVYGLARRHQRLK
jgi:ADP-ribosylglycohydrolase